MPGSKARTFDIPTSRSKEGCTQRAGRNALPRYCQFQPVLSIGATKVNWQMSKSLTPLSICYAGDSQITQKLTSVIRCQPGHVVRNVFHM